MLFVETVSLDVLRNCGRELHIYDFLSGIFFFKDRERSLIHCRRESDSLGCDLSCIVFSYSDAVLCPYDPLPVPSVFLSVVARDVDVCAEELSLERSRCL